MNTKAKILIADDSSFMRRVLVDTLSKEGFSNFIECSTGAEALEKIASEKPDLCLLDIVMPVMDGMEVVKKVGKDQKVIIISAVGQEGMIEEAKQYGAKGYVVKPFDRKQVVEEVSRVLG